MYYWVKTIHVTCVTVTGSFFALRFYWMITRPALLQKSWVKRVPVAVDTTLLISGIAMAIMSYQYPLVLPWLTAKLAALLVYIIAGSIALKRGPTRRIRIYAGIFALSTVLYIISVALTRNPIPSNILDVIAARFF
jgi:uncharacterized membrane protein SirB2